MAILVFHLHNVSKSKNLALSIRLYEDGLYREVIGPWKQKLLNDTQWSPDGTAYVNVRTGQFVRTLIVRAADNRTFRLLFQRQHQIRQERMARYGKTHHQSHAA